MTYQFQTAPEVCSERIVADIENGRINQVTFVGGCPGSLLAVGKLVKGMTVAEAAAALEGIRCGGKATSCPDQLSRMLKKIAAETEKK